MNLLFYLILIILIPSIAYANAGNAIMWAYGLHLFISNIIVAFIESLYIYYKFKTFRLLFIYLIVIAGNYASSLVGLLCLGLLTNSGFNWFHGITYENMKEAIFVSIILIVVAFIVSIIIELPFIKFTIPKKEGIKSLIKTTIIANLLSYIFVVLIYLYFLIEQAYLYKKYN